MKLISQFSWKYLRHYSTKSPYSSTVLLPKTNFSAKITKEIVRQERVIQETSEFDNLYEWQWENHKDKPVFILHDGPPYANGDVHVGHALNKILKDITNRYKMLRGYRVHYIPGWDCHGLPIEIKAIKGKDFTSLSPIEIRDKAHTFAKSTIETQKKAFRRWGIMANWKDDGCYYTFDKQYEMKELKAFHQIFQKGLIYRDLKPVYWSPSSVTALAEAELEYNTEHRSRSAYVSFPLATPNTLGFSSSSTVRLIVWTTQPWTIPANQAICFSPDINYCLLRNSHKSPDEYYIISVNQVEALSKTLNVEFEVVMNVDRNKLDHQKCLHPMDSSRTVPVLPSSHVTHEKGTGFVHIAPAHGIEDFNIAVQHGLDFNSDIDDYGRFSDSAGYNLAGKYIFTEGNSEVLSQLNENKNLIHAHDYVHSYPYDWRTKKPIFVKTSRQWFINTEALLGLSKNLIKDVQFIPNSGRESMVSILKGRRFWCISRQRTWGVPIPVFYHRNTGEMLLTNSSMERMISLFKEHGSSVWWKYPTAHLLTQSIVDEAGFTNSTCDDFETGKDILDIWFDSGVTWASVLGEEDIFGFPTADLYLEGKDQFRGWFQSSLLTCAAICGKAPYKSVFVHGFVMSESGKMSKSLGNVVNPEIVIEGGKNINKNPPYGADTLRWWVAESNVHQEVLIGPRLLNAARDSINKIRNSFRFMLGNLSDFDPKKHRIAYDDMLTIDKYMLHVLHQYTEEVTQAYNEYNYAKVTRTLLSIITKLSNFYFHIVKDRLYCEEQHGRLRASCQTTLYHILNVLSSSVAPILPYTVTNVTMHHPCPRSSSVFKDDWCGTQIADEWKNGKNAIYSMEIVLQIRNNLLAKLDGRQAVLYDVSVNTTDSRILQYLQGLQSVNTTQISSELQEILGCSQCTVSSAVHCSTEEDLFTIELSTSESGTCSVTLSEPLLFKCQRCRYFTSLKSTEPCEKCADVIARTWAV